MVSKIVDVSGKVVVVTGASMGIGEAIAKIFADRGSRVVLLSRDAGRAEAARGRIGHTDRTLALSCDVRNREEIDRVLSLTLHHFERIDLWINNAGHGLQDSVAHMDMAACRDMFDTNFFGTVFAMQAVIPVMKQQGSGTIANISSVAGHIPLPFHAAYSATKAAVRSFARTWILDLKERKIRVNAISLGPIGTPGLDGLAQTKGVGGQLKASLLAGVPLGRLGTPDEIAKAAVFLASDDSSFVTGTELFVDGGTAQI